MERAILALNVYLVIHYVSFNSMKDSPILMHKNHLIQELFSSSQKI